MLKDRSSSSSSSSISECNFKTTISYNFNTEVVIHNIFFAERKDDSSSDSSSSKCSGTTQNPTDTEMSLGTEENYRPHIKSPTPSDYYNQYRYGSFYLRMGAVGRYSAYCC